MRFFLSLIVLTCSLFACSKKDTQEISLKLNEGKYKIINRGDGIMAKDGQYLLYSLFFTDENGNVFLDRRNSDNLMREQVKRDSFSLSNLAPVSEMIYELSKGDSAVLRVPLVKGEKVKELKNSDTLKFYVKVFDIINEEQVLEYLSHNFKGINEQNNRYDQEYEDIRKLLFQKLKELDAAKGSMELFNLPNGIKYFILKQGNGRKIEKGNKVKFDYIGLTDPQQKEFDNSFLKTQDIEIVVGERKELVVWDEAIAVMKKDMIGVFFVPSDKAYGKAGKPGLIPPDSDLIYLIKVNGIIN